jgi:hypothetical protein
MERRQAKKQHASKPSLQDIATAIQKCHQDIRKIAELVTRAREERGAGLACQPPAAQALCANDADAGVDQSPLLSETLESFSDLALAVPGSKKPHSATLARWAKGLRNGVRLEFVTIGGRKLSSRPALFRFLLACQQGGWAGIEPGRAAAIESVLARHKNSSPTERRGDDT